MSFFSKKPKEYLNLIIDIQSSIVRGSLVHTRGVDLPHILWNSNIDIPYRADGGSTYLVELTIKAIQDIATAAKVFVHNTHIHSGNVPKHISKVHCVLSSPWIVSQARTVSQEFEKDTKISRAHVQDIINAERVTMSKSTDDRMMSIEEKIFDVRLNGYSIPEWNGAVGRTFEVSFAISLASKAMTKRFTDAAKYSGVSGSHIDFHSSLLLQHVGLGSVLPMHGPHILIHVHGELTDIVVASGQTCVLFGSHPTGVRTIVRRLASELGTAESSADSMLTMFESGQIDALHGSADVERINSVMSTWTADCMKVTSLVPENYIPTRAMISSRYHEIIFKNTFSSAYPLVKADLLPSDILFTLVTLDPQVEKLRLTILYIVAIHSLESL